ncbi:MAG TPA: cell envelope integrity protein CreD [Spirochaetia bacterium]|nr:cell envelope integrity protein CreD [Spirochaetia bacterium]
MSTHTTVARAARRHSVIVKLVIIGVLLLLFLWPLFMFQLLVREREERRKQTESEIMQSWGGEQTLAGPILTVPYIAHSTDEKGRRVESVEAAFFLPDSLVIDGRLLPETRSRGMYEVTVSTADLSLRGTFHAPDFSGWRVSPADILWDQAALSLELPDMRALQERVPLSWGGTKGEFHSGKGGAGMFAGEIRASLSGLGPGGAATEGRGASSGGAIPFSFTLALRGGDSIRFLPLGDETVVTISSPWKSPNFNGSYLPVRRSLSTAGFDAQWRVISMARAYPQRWRGAEIEPQSVLGTGFGVSLMTPVDTYLKTTRALKYGLLFLFLPFGTLFLFEVFSGRRIHPLQYLLIGLADCIFYLLLLSLAEHIGFALAYAAASAACAALVTLYTVAVVKRSTGIVMLPVLAAAYGFLAVVLNSEDFALLIGAVGLFALLGIVMYLTRKVDWYRKEASLEAGDPSSPAVAESRAPESPAADL